MASSSIVEDSHEEPLYPRYKNTSVLYTWEAQQPDTPRFRLSVLNGERWQYLMDVRKSLVKCGTVPQQLNNDIERAHAADAVPEIDLRMHEHVEFVSICDDLQLSSSEKMDLWSYFTIALYTQVTRPACEDCVAEVGQMLSRRKQMDTIQLSTRSIDCEIKARFESVKHLLNHTSSENAADLESILNPESPTLRAKNESIKSEDSPIIREKNKPENNTNRGEFPSHINAVAPLTTSKTKMKRFPSPTEICASLGILPQSIVETRKESKTLVRESSTRSESSKTSSILGKCLKNVLNDITLSAPLDYLAIYTNLKSDSGSLRRDRDILGISRKRQKTNAPVYLTKICQEPFECALNTAGNGFLSLEVDCSVPWAHLMLKFDIQSQSLVVTHPGNPLSTIWSELEVSAQAIYRIDRTNMLSQGQYLVRMHYLDGNCQKRILEVEISSFKTVKTLVQKMQHISGCEEVIGYLMWVALLAGIQTFLTSELTCPDSSRPNENHVVKSHVEAPFMAYIAYRKPSRRWIGGESHYLQAAFQPIFDFFK